MKSRLTLKQTVLQLEVGESHEFASTSKAQSARAAASHLREVERQYALSGRTITRLADRTEWHEPSYLSAGIHPQ